ncbi:hypothetical protein [Thermoplasma sp.]|uniref:hypothetical protein n=1 Tax=Thermoplasma sp. TaxID=1973142 RepID=UPI00261C7816|nr:hypothetical protein [Thermoplasma sp.]
MEENELIGIARIYRDKDGAGRLYLPKKLLESLSWQDKQQILLRTDGTKLIGTPAEEVDHGEIRASR